jgi:tRNA(Arg) A34 adenosine deaminase TadA
VTEPNSIYGAVRAYLAGSASRYQRGEDEYYARLALEQAMLAGVAGNFGIGAVAVVRDGPVAREYRAGNALFTGLGVVDHAEVRALLKWRQGLPPDDEYSVSGSERLESLVEGVHVFGTVEPCPMCACALTHINAARSISTNLDGSLARRDGEAASDGAAAAIGAKQRLQPIVGRRSRWLRACSSACLIPKTPSSGTSA